MPASLSKEKGGEDAEAKKKRLVRVIGPAVFLNVISGAMLFSARQALAMQQFKSAEELALFLGKLGSAGALMEFLLNPIFGKLSDTFGRRAIAPLGNLSTVICRILLYTNPDKLWPLILEQLATTPLITSFFTTWRATLGDELEGALYAKAQAEIGISAGLAIIVGPLITYFIMNRMHVKYCFLVSVALSSSCLAYLGLNYPETLPVEKRVPLKVFDMQPLSFLKVMRTSPTLCRLMLVTGLQTCSEGRSVTDILSIYLQKDLGWSWNGINKFIGAYGISLVVSGVLVKDMIQKLGLSRFTTFSNLLNAANLFTYTNLPPLSYLISNDLAMWLGMMLASPAARKRDGVEALVMTHGTRAGLGNGFISGAIMNWRAVINTLGPITFGFLYQYGTKRGMPNLPFLAGALTCLSAEVVMRSMSNQELGLDEKGYLIKDEANKAVEKPEEAKTPKSEAQSVADEALIIFRAIDKNKDGYLTRSEIGKYLQKNPEMRNTWMQGKSFKAFYAELQENADGVNTWDAKEWAAWYTKKFGSA